MNPGGDVQQNTPIPTIPSTPSPIPSVTPVISEKPTISVTPTQHPAPFPSISPTPKPTPTAVPSPTPTISALFRNNPVTLIHNEETTQDGFPGIKIQSQSAFQILSVRLNGEECFWHWEEDILVVERTPDKKNENMLQMTIRLLNGKIIQMEPWKFA
jgi:hypothetical protein